MKPATLILDHPVEVPLTRPAQVLLVSYTWHPPPSLLMGLRATDPVDKSHFSTSLTGIGRVSGRPLFAPLLHFFLSVTGMGT